MRRSKEIRDMHRVAELQTAHAYRRKLIGVMAFVVGIVFVVGMYFANSDTLGITESSFPPLSELPQLGKVVVEAGKSPRFTGARLGETAPDFTFIDPSGASKKLSDYRGQAVMINFWASWCPYCIKEMPDIESVYRDEGAKGFVVLGINLDEDTDAARRFLQARGVTFPSIFDTGFTVSTLYRIQPLPASFFIDRQGIIRDIQVGAMTKGTIRQKVNKVL